MIQKKKAPFIKIRHNPHATQPPPPPEQTEDEKVSTPQAPLSIEDDIYGSCDNRTGDDVKEGDVSEQHLVFKHPFTCLIAGPTSSGKTVFATRLLKHRKEMIKPGIEEIIWCYGIASPQLAHLKDTFGDMIKFHKGVPDMERLSQKDTSVNRLIVLDDMMNEKKGNAVANMFSRESHHLNYSILYLSQNVFNQSKEMRNIFLNAHYKVIFKSPSDMSQLNILNGRMFPGHPNFFNAVMQEASKRSCHAYLVLDAHTRTPDDLRVRTDIFPGEDNGVYLPA